MTRRQLLGIILFILFSALGFLTSYLHPLLMYVIISVGVYFIIHYTIIPKISEDITKPRDLDDEEFYNALGKRKDLK